MGFLARYHKVVSLRDALDHLESGSPESVLAVTFDDGYQDNYLHAFPILHRYGLPATVFLTTGSLDSRDPLWFEELSGALKNTTNESVNLTIDIPRRLWLRTEAERLAANGRIFQLLRGLTDQERQLHLTDILRELGHRRGARQDQMLTWGQIRLMKAGRIDFGGHTVNHPFLSRIPPQQVSWEVSECKRRIEEELQQQVEHFAYPNGREEDFVPANKELLRAAGYKAAVTTIWGVNYMSTDRMELRRSGPWEEDPALFACKLDWYQLLND
jgi:peptidoglycan/xylan/chitin deacetylase (PgdA/CDA1 family)